MSLPLGRRLFRDDGASIGVTIGNLLSPSLFGVIAASGADYGFIDMEHTRFSYADVAMLITSAHAVGIPAVVRPPEITRGSVGRLLDLGADGILAPRGERPGDAADLARFGRYPPLGERGDDGRIFAATDPRTLAAQLNENIALIASVETREALESIDEICSTPGIDGIWIGTADLSLALDVPGELSSPIYRAAEERILAACQTHGMRFASGGASTPADAIEQSRLGCFTVAMDNETTLLERAIAGYVASVRDGLASP